MVVGACVCVVECLEAVAFGVVEPVGWIKQVGTERRACAGLPLSTSQQPDGFHPDFALIAVIQHCFDRTGPYPMASDASSIAMDRTSQFRGIRVSVRHFRPSTPLATAAKTWPATGSCPAEGIAVFTLRPRRPPQRRRPPSEPPRRARCAARSWLYRIGRPSPAAGFESVHPTTLRRPAGSDMGGSTRRRIRTARAGRSRGDLGRDQPLDGDEVRERPVIEVAGVPQPPVPRLRPPAAVAGCPGSPRGD